MPVDLSDGPSGDGIARVRRRLKGRDFVDTPRAFGITCALLVSGLIVALGATSAEVVEHAITSFALLIGGAWTLYQFVLKRAFESALRIDVTVATATHGPHHVVHLTVGFENAGHRRLFVVPDTVDSFDDSVRFPADLEIRQITATRPQLIDWWHPTGGWAVVAGVPNHISLLDEYQLGEDGPVDFFMEPGETCRTTKSVVLPNGSYLAKVVFVGTRTDSSEYWSRIVAFNVPSEAAVSDGSEIDSNSSKSTQQQCAG